MFGLYKVMTTKGEIHFIGRYRRDLETNNWHYYEKENGIDGRSLAGLINDVENSEKS